MPEGYCTLEDVRRALRKSDLPGDVGQDEQIAADAIVAESEWLREKTSAHWYEPGGVAEDDRDLIPTDVKSRGPEEGDIPSTPHPQHSTLFDDDRGRYPRRMNGPYTRIRLGKMDVDQITTLEVRDAGGGYTDWVADDSKIEGEDYDLYVKAGGTPSESYLDLRVSSLPALRHYDNAIRVSYDYGIEGLSRTVRRAVALRAAAELVEEAVIQIPDNATIYNVGTKAEKMCEKAAELLEDYR